MQKLWNCLAIWSGAVGFFKFVEHESARAAYWCVSAPFTLCNQRTKQSLGKACVQQITCKLIESQMREPCNILKYKLQWPQPPHHAYDYVPFLKSWFQNRKKERYRRSAEQNLSQRNLNTLYVNESLQQHCQKLVAEYWNQNALDKLGMTSDKQSIQRWPRTTC